MGQAEVGRSIVRSGEAPKASILVYRPFGGGAEKIIMGIARLLERRGQLARLYTGSAVGLGEFASMNVVVLNSVRALGAIAPLLRKVRHDKAETFLLTANYLALATALRVAKPRARIIVRVASIVSVEMRYRDYLSRMRYFVASALAFWSASLIITQGQEMRNDLIKAYPLARKKTVVIRNFIEAEIWNHKPSKPVSYRYIFCAAAFRPVKAFDTLLAAFSVSPSRQNRKLVIAGVNSDDVEFSKLMHTNGLSDNEVVRLGFIAKPYDWIANADLCVLASRYEGFSNFLLEAAAFGKRIVATRCPGGNKEILALYGNSIAVGVDDIAALADAVAAERHDISREKARSLLSEFEWKTIAKSYIEALFPEEPFELTESLELARDANHEGGQ